MVLGRNWDLDNMKTCFDGKFEEKKELLILMSTSEQNNDSTLE